MQYMDAPHVVLIFSCGEPYYLRFLGALQICGGGSVVVGGLLGHFLDSMLPQYMALPVREKYKPILIKVGG